MISVRPLFLTRPSHRAALVCAFAWLATPAVSAGTSSPDSVVSSQPIQPSTVAFDSATRQLKAWVGAPSCRQCIVPENRAYGAVVGLPIESDRQDHSVSAWGVTFQLVVPSRPFVRGLITVFVDSTGAPIDSVNITGIGNCATNPQKCEFPIDEKQARAIAKRDGLEPGIRPWDVHFTWNRKGLYLWGVSNTLHVLPDGCSANGHDLLIDASDGHIYAKDMVWMRTCCELQNRDHAVPGPRR